MKRPDRTEAALWAALMLPVLWLAAAVAQAIDMAAACRLAAHLSALIAAPFSVHWSASTGKFLLLALICYPLGRVLLFRGKIPAASRRRAWHGTLGQCVLAQPEIP